MCYRRAGLLDTLKHSHYGARDFGGCSPRTTGLVWAVISMADSRNTKRSLGNAGRSKTGALAARIRRARTQSPGKAAAFAMRQRELSGAGRAFRMASEFVAAVIVATALGLALDAVFGTRPVLMIVLLLLGFGAGMLNVVRAAAEMNAAAPKPDPDRLVPVDDDDDDD